MRSGVGRCAQPEGAGASEDTRGGQDRLRRRVRRRAHIRGCVIRRRRASLGAEGVLPVHAVRMVHALGDADAGEADKEHLGLSYGAFRSDAPRQVPLARGGGVRRRGWSDALRRYPHDGEERPWVAVLPPARRAGRRRVLPRGWRHEGRARRGEALRARRRRVLRGVRGGPTGWRPRADARVGEAARRLDARLVQHAAVAA